MTERDQAEFNSRLRQFFAENEIANGFIRNPFSSSTSHDELLGAAYLSSDFAARAVDFLSRKDGSYSIEDPKLSDNIYRFVFMLPALKAFAGFQVSLLSQFMFSVLVLWDAFVTKPGQANDTLKIWLCYPAMHTSEKPLSSFCLSVWEDRWQSRGYNPKSIFKNNYLTECPLMNELASERFRD